MDKLYAPWRDKYVEDSVKGQRPDAQKTCVFCEVFAENISEQEHYILHKQSDVVIMLNLYPYNGGHVLVVPRQHVSNLHEVSQETLHSLMTTVATSTKLIQQSLGCEGINFGANIGRIAGAGIPQHVHLHIVPRWQGDTGFLPVIGETKQVSVDLNRIYQKLKPVFDKEFLG